MQRKTKIALTAGAVMLAGAAGFATLAAAGYGKGGWHRGHHGGHKIERMLERFDANEDGKLTQEELNASRKALLARHDTDKDGELSLAEFEKLWVEVMQRRMVRGFQRLDRDGNAQVTLDEFLKPYSHAVERMDRNDDDAISRDDRRRHGGRHHRGGDKKGHHRGSHGEREG